MPRASRKPDQLAASRFLTGDPFVYIEVDGRRLLAVGDFEVARATSESGADEVWGYSELGISELYAGGLDRHAIERELALRAARRAGLSSVVVPGWFPLATAEYLRGAGHRACASTTTASSSGGGARTPTRSTRSARSPRSSRTRCSSSGADSPPATSDADGTLRDDGGVLTSERLHAAVRAFWAENGLEGEMPIIAGGAHAADPHDVGAGPAARAARRSSATSSRAARARATTAT